MDKEYVIVLVSSVCVTAVITILIFIILLTLKKRLKPRPRASKKSLKNEEFGISKSRAMSDGVDNVAFTSENNERAVRKLDDSNGFKKFIFIL